MREITIEIHKPQDGGKAYTSLVKSDLFYRVGTTNASIYPDRSAKDPLHHSMKAWFKSLLKKP